MNNRIKKVPCCGAGKRVLLCAFILTASFAAMPVYAVVGDVFVRDGVVYKALTEAGTTGTVEVTDATASDGTRNRNYAGANLSIPVTVMNGTVTYDVVSVADNAFRDCTGLTGTLTLPSSVTYIGQYAFYGTAIAGTLTIPSSVTYIGFRAFRECAGITALELPASGSLDIAAGVFIGTGIAGTLTIPSSVTSIGSDAFRECAGITTLYWRTNLDIPDRIFWNCTSLSAIYISAATAPSVESYTFNGIPATGTLYYQTGATGYSTAAAFKLPSGWTLQAIHFPALALAANPAGGQTFPGNVVLTATLTDADNNVGKPIVFTVDGAVYATVNTDGSGVATCTVSGLTAGTYDFGASFAGNTGVNAPASAPDITGYTVVKANATVSTAPAANTLTYTGAAQTLVSAGTASGGTMEYSLTSGSSYSTSIPTGTNAGTYTVYYKVTGDANHNDAAEASVGVTIGQFNLSGMTLQPIANVTYDGNPHRPVPVIASGGITFQIADTAYIYSANTNAGTNTAQATIGVGTSGNCTGSVSRPFTILKASGATVSIPAVSSTTASSITVSPVTVTPPNPGGQSVEYAVGTSLGVTPSTGWQAGTTFSGLASGTAYYIYARTVGNANCHTGTASESAAITTAVFIAPTFPLMSAPLPPAVVDTPYAGASVTASGSPAPTYTATGLPAGLTLNPSTGALSGTPSAAGAYNVTVTATNAGGSASVTLPLVVGEALHAAAATPALLDFGDDYSWYTAGPPVPVAVRNVGCFALSADFVWAAGHAFRVSGSYRDVSSGLSSAASLYPFDSAVVSLSVRDFLPPGDYADTLYVAVPGYGRVEVMVVRFTVSDWAPPVIRRRIELSVSDGFTTDPPPGMSYYVDRGKDFYVTVTPASPDLVPVVTTSRNEPDEVILTRDPSTGACTARIRGIRSMITVYVKRDDSGTGLESVLPADATYTVHAAGGRLYVTARQPAIIYIYTAAGQLFRQQTVEAGEMVITLPRGVYVVVMDGKRWKVVSY